MEYDVFISYASEDSAVATQLKNALEEAGKRVWLDKAELEWGQSLTKQIDSGLARSHYGIVILSSSYLGKRWPEREMRALLSRSVTEERGVLLPLLVSVEYDEVVERYALLRDTLMVQWEGNARDIVKRVPPTVESSGGLTSSSDANSPDPQVLSDRVKRLLGNGQKIELHDLLKTLLSEINDTISDEDMSASASAFFPNLTEEIARRIDKLKMRSLPLCAVAATIAYYGLPDDERLLASALSVLRGKLRARTRHGTSEPLFHVQEVPLLFLVHCIGIAAILSGRWSALQSVFLAPDSNERGYSENLLETISPKYWSHNEKLAIQPKGKTLKTPIEDFLLDTLRSVCKWVKEDPIRLEEALDQWLFIGQIHVSWRYSINRGFGGYFSYGRFWRHQWHDKHSASPMHQLMDAVKRDGNGASVLESKCVADADQFLRFGGEVLKQMETENFRRI